MAALKQTPQAKIIDEEIGAYRALEAQQNAILQSRNGLISQLNENAMVKEELDKLDDETPVFKLIGPALMRQDVEEAKQNVDKRIEFIQSEISKSEAKIEKNKKQMEVHGEKVMKMQGEMQMKAKQAADEVIARQSQLEDPDE